LRSVRTADCPDQEEDRATRLHGQASAQVDVLAVVLVDAGVLDLSKDRAAETDALATVESDVRARPA
jgi:hypothetical protein